MLPHWLRGTLLGGAIEAAENPARSHLVFGSIVVLLSWVAATAKLISHKNKVAAVGVAVALLIGVPSTFANTLSTWTMQRAYEAGRYLDRSSQQPQLYNMGNVVMAIAPWLVVDLVGPQKADVKRKKKKAKKIVESDEDEVSDKKEAAKQELEIKPKGRKSKKTK